MPPKSQGRASLQRTVRQISVCSLVNWPFPSPGDRDSYFLRAVKSYLSSFFKYEMLTFFQSLSDLRSKIWCSWLIQKLEWTKIVSYPLKISIYRWDYSQISAYMGYKTEVDCPKSSVIPRNFIWNRTGNRDILSSHKN